MLTFVIGNCSIAFRKKFLEENMFNQSQTRNLLGSLSLLVLVTACGKNMNLAIPADSLDSGNQKLGATQKKSADGITVSNTGTAVSSASDATDSEGNVVSNSIDSGLTIDANNNVVIHGIVADQPYMNKTSVLQPLSEADVAALSKKGITLNRADRDQNERKTARVLFKMLPRELLASATKTEKTPVLDKKGKQKKDKKGKLVFKESSSISGGALKMTLIINKADSDLDLNNFKVCMFKDMATDLCRTHEELLAKSAYVGDVNDDKELKVDMMKAFDLTTDSVFSYAAKIRLNTEAVTFSPYYRKLRLSFNGLNTAVGAQLLVESSATPGAAIPADYNEAILENVAPSDLIASKIQ
jgi:hypothetical protein